MMEVKGKLDLLARSLSVAGIMLAAIPGVARAGEGTVPAGPIGGTDIAQALPLPAGVYGALYGAVADATKWYGPDGETETHKAHLLAGGFGLGVVYPVTIFGGSVRSSIAAGYEQTCARFSGPAQCTHGARDLYSDIFFWSRFFPSADYSSQPEGSHIPYGLAVGFGLGVNFPTGQYSTNQWVNVGSNVYDFAPSIAVTYNMRSLLGNYFGQATEFSGRLFLNTYTKDHAHNYQSGMMPSLDFAVTERNNNWQYGIAGFAYYQIQDDVVDGVNIGNRSKLLELGPLVSYTFKAAGRPMNLTAKALFAIDGRNTPFSSSLFVRLATKF